MNIPSIDGAHYSRATSRVNKKKKEMTRTRSLATDIQITLTFLAIFVLTFLELHGVCRFPEIPITRRRLAFKDVSSNRETQRDQSRLIRRTSTFSFFPLGINERESALKGDDAAHSFAYQPAKRFSKYRRDRALRRQITVRFTFDGSFEPRDISSLG